MVQIVLNDEQAAILYRASGIIQFVDCSGRDLGHLVPPQTSAAETTECLDPNVGLALRRMMEAKNGGSFYSTQEVLEHLNSANQP